MRGDGWEPQQQMEATLGDQSMTLGLRSGQTRHRISYTHQHIRAPIKLTGRSPCPSYDFHLGCFRRGPSPQVAASL